ncbi:hypothetical protein GQR58_024985 [Nymphon striatum]|nr:hypothetical protein GQR58_024985 [Nymphon striatum]
MQQNTFDLNTLNIAQATSLSSQNPKSMSEDVFNSDDEGELETKEWHKHMNSRYTVFIYVIDSKSSIDDFRNWHPLQGRKFKHNKYRHTVINRQQNSTTFKLQNKHRNNVSISAKIHTIIQVSAKIDINHIIKTCLDLVINTKGALLANSNDFEDETQNKIKELISSLSKKEVELCSSNQESKKLLEANQNVEKNNTEENNDQINTVVNQMEVLTEFVKEDCEKLLEKLDWGQENITFWSPEQCLAQQATSLLEAEGIRQMCPACTNVWVRDLGNYRYPVEKIGECPTQYGKKDPRTGDLDGRPLLSSGPVRADDDDHHHFNQKFGQTAHEDKKLLNRFIHLG